MNSRYAVVAGILCSTLLLPTVAHCQTQTDAAFTPQEMEAAWHKVAATYPAEVAQAKKEGIPLSVKDFKKPLPPGAENAALVYRQMMGKHAPGDAETVLSDFSTLNAPTPAQIDKARQALAQSSDLLRLVHEAAARPKCVFDRAWDTENPAAIPLPELSYIRAAVRLLNEESLLLAYDGKFSEAIRNQALGFRLARHAASDQLMISFLVGEAVEAITLNGFKKILIISKGDQTVARNVLKVLDTERHPLRLADALRSEAAFQQSEMEIAHHMGYLPFLSLMQGLAGGGDPPDTAHPAPGGNGSQPAEGKSFLGGIMSFLGGMVEKKLTDDMNRRTEPLIDASAAYMLHQMRVLIPAADLPYPQAEPVFARVQKDLEGKGTTPTGMIRAIPSILMPEYEHVVEHKAREEATFQTLRAGAAILAYRAEHGGNLPETLGKALSPVPPDPFNGKPLHYRKEGAGKNAGFFVYSTGADGFFDGGKPGVKLTGNNVGLVFHYPPAVH